MSVNDFENTKFVWNDPFTRTVKGCNYFEFLKITLLFLPTNILLMSTVKDCLIVSLFRCSIYLNKQVLLISSLGLQ